MRDGRVKVSFEDGTWVVVEPTGACYTFYDASRSGGVLKERCLTAFARQRHCKGVALALDFRNAYSPVPFWCKALEKRFEVLGKVTWTSQIRVERASWVVPAGLRYDTEKDSLTVKSKDGKCSFHLQSGKRRFSVCYPINYKVAESEGAGPVYSYYLQEQHFSSNDCPEKWKPLLQAVLDQVNDQEGGRKTVMLVRDLPLPCTTSETAKWIDVEKGSFWDTCRDVLYPRDTTVVLEWTPYCLFRFAYDLGEAEVLTYFDGNLLVSRNGGKEFEHISPNARGDRIHRPAGGFGKARTAFVTPDKIGEQSGTIFAFYNTVVDYASKFLEHMKHVKQVVSQGEYKRNAKGAPLVSNRVLVEKYDEDVGNLVAFEDGRVWIKFIDKAFLEMDHEQKYCKVYLPRGDVRIVRTHKPVGVEDYVHIAKEFAHWAFQTPNERDQHIELHSTIMAQIEASKRLSKMIDWHLGSSMSPSLLAT